MSKKAQDSFQIRASLLHGKKINIFQIFDLFLLENICTFNGAIFFHPYCTPNSSINCQQYTHAWGTNPNLKNKPKLLQNFDTFLKNRVCISSRSQPSKTTPL